MTSLAQNFFLALMRLRRLRRVTRRNQRKERFLSTQADRFAGAKREEKIGLLRSK